MCHRAAVVDWECSEVVLRRPVEWRGALTEAYKTLALVTSPANANSFAIFRCRACELLLGLLTNSSSPCSSFAVSDLQQMAELQQTPG
jgi:hypothetical protein